MTDTDKKILDTFKELLPELSDPDKEKVLAFGEGMAFVINQNKEKTA